MALPSRLRGFVAALDHVTAIGAWAVLPLALLLFAQWPLRDLVGAWSRDANDAAQWIFALYVAVAVRAATRARAQLFGRTAPTGRTRALAAPHRSLRRGALRAPWALLVLVAGAPSTWRSLISLEAFPDTFNPLYFVIRCSAWLLRVRRRAAGAARARRRRRRPGPNDAMSWIGLALFVVAIALMVTTGLPAYAVLLATASVGAALGIALGTFEWPILGALPARVVGLLEHDLLQSLPLYALIGALLNRLPLAGLLHRAGERVFARSGAAAEMSALGVGALLAPMNGSVGASLHALSQRVAPALAAKRRGASGSGGDGLRREHARHRHPPSLVLLLLGDAMMRAHTEAANATHRAVQIVNTQDIVRAALLPGLLVFAAALAIAAWRGRSREARALAPLGRGAALQAAAVALVIVLLLAAVASGRLYAVEAAATGAVGLLVWAVAARRLDAAALRGVLADAMVLTGVLMALLVAATSFSLVLRALGTDGLVADGLALLAGRPHVLLGAVLLGLVLCSFVLDAFEMIFLVIPIVMPPLLAAVPDAAWVAALTLVVLQAGFLLPPLGYAIVMSRRTLATPVPAGALARALVPQLAAQALVVALLIAAPQIVHWADDAPSPAAPAASEADIERMMNAAPSGREPR